MDFTQKEIKMLWNCVFAEMDNANAGLKKFCLDERVEEAIKAYKADLYELLQKVNSYMTDEEVKNITGSEKRAQKVAEWAENAQDGQKKSAIGKYTVEVRNTKEGKNQWLKG